MILWVRFTSNADGSSFLCDIYYPVGCDAYSQSGLSRYPGEVISNLDTGSMAGTSQVICDTDTRNEVYVLAYYVRERQ